MTRWSAITRTRGPRSALAYGSRSTTAAEDNLNRLVHHESGRYCRVLLERRENRRGHDRPRNDRWNPEPVMPLQGALRRQVMRVVLVDAVLEVLRGLLSYVVHGSTHLVVSRQKSARRRSPDTLV